MKRAVETLEPFVRHLPEELREEAANALSEYLEIVIARLDEQEGLTGEDDRHTLSYSV